MTRCALMVLLCLLLPARGVAQDSGVPQKSLVAMLQTVDQAGKFDSTLCAAAIVLSVGKDRTLLLTAAHVLDALDTLNQDRKLAGQPPVALAAQFYGTVGRFFQVRALPGITNAKLDYAVLEVMPLPGAAVPPPPSWAVLGLLEDMTKATPSGKAAFQDVRAIGNNKCEPWLASASTEKVVSRTGNEIIFETHFVDRGNSGGALFAGDGSLVGMVTETEGDVGVATRLDVLLADLQAKNVAVDWAAKEYGDMGEDNASRGPSSAQRVTAKSIDANIVETSYDFVRFQLQADKIFAYSVMRATAMKGQTKVDDNDQLEVKISEAVLGGYRMDLLFADKSTLSLPIDLKPALSARIASLASPDHPWLSLQDYRLYAIGYSQRDTGFVRDVAVGFAPDALVFRITDSYGPSGKVNRPGVVGLNTADSGGVPVPPGSKSAWYRITFVDGSVSPVMEYRYPADRTTLTASRLVKSDEGVMFAYRFGYDDSNPGSGGALYLSRPVGLKNGGTLQYDSDGKGFVNADRDQGAGLPWTTRPIKIRYLNSDTGAVTGPFSLPGFDLSAIREASDSGFPNLACDRKTGNFQCRIDDLIKIGLIRAISVSFVSEKAMKPVTLGDPMPYWRTKEGRELFRLCHRNTLPECDRLRAELGIAWAVPPGAKDFYYAVTMIDGRTLPPQRRQLQIP